MAGRSAWASRRGPASRVRTLSFEALDETGWDWTGSDEVAFVYNALGYKLITREYGGVDSDGTTPNLKWCVVPAEDRDEDYNHAWDCHEAGMPGPVSFVIGAYEQDGHSGFCATSHADTDIRSPNLETCEEDGELIGKDDLQIPLATLFQKLPQPGASYTDRFDLFGACDGSTTTSPCTSGGGPHYVVIYEVRRLPDAVAPPLTPNP